MRTKYDPEVLGFERVHNITKRIRRAAKTPEGLKGKALMVVHDLRVIGWLCPGHNVVHGVGKEQAPKCLLLAS